MRPHEQLRHAYEYLIHDRHKDLRNGVEYDVRAYIQACGILGNAYFLCSQGHTSQPTPKA